MLSLCLDSSTERGVVAILNEEQLLFHSELPFGLQNSKSLLPAIEQGMGETGIRFSDLAFITLGIGPGSYTGIRVGAAVAKTFSFAEQVPLVGISTLEGFIPVQNGNFAAMIDAKISGVYMLTGRCIDGQIVYTSEPHATALEHVPEELKGISTVITSNKKRLETLWKDSHWNWVEQGLNPVHMTRLALQKFHQGDFSTDSSMELLYLRRTQAEIEKDLNS